MAGDHPRLAAALAYAERGWDVIPCQPGGKAPLGRLVPNGVKGATTDRDLIRQWWLDNPNANIGLRTGEAFDVLDIDGVEALVALEGLAPIGRAEIVGPTVATPNGWHCYLGVTGEGNRTAIRGCRGLDWRGRNGFVIAPPSTQHGGATYDWIEIEEYNFDPEGDLRPAPKWLLDLLARSKPLNPETQPLRHSDRTDYGAAAMDRELGILARSPVGSRNDQLNRSSFALGQLVTAQMLTAREVGDALLLVATRIGLGEVEARATITSGLEAGIRNPRSVSR